MCFIDKYKNIILNIIPEEYLNELISKTNENELLETLIYEISLGITKENIDNSINIISKIIQYKPYKKYILIKCIKNIQRKSKTIQKVIDYFDLKDIEINDIELNNINIKQDINKYFNIFYEDDLEEYIKLIQNNDLNEEHQFYYLKVAIKTDAENISKYIIDHNDFTDMFLYSFLITALNTGNRRIIDMLLFKDISFDDISDNTIINSHHLDIIYDISRYRTFNFNNISYTRSLYFHFVKNIKFCCTGLSHDLSCVSNHFNPVDIIYSNAINIAYEQNNVTYTINCLIRIIKNNNKELFKVVFNKMIEQSHYKYENLKDKIKDFNEYYEFV